MLRTSLFLLFAALSISSVAQPAQANRFLFHNKETRESGTFLYTLTKSTATYTDLVNPISINNGEIWDDPEYAFPIGFEFELLEGLVTEFEFYGSGAFFRAPTGDPEVDAYLFPFESDLLDRGALTEEESLSPIGYTVEGTPGNRIFKLEFKNAGAYGEYAEYNTMDMFINFQMWLYEASKIIQFRYGPSSIEDPSVFYDGETGAGIGAANYNESEDIVSHLHFIVGDPSQPILSSNQEFIYIDGTPANGTVYTLSLDLPIEIDLIATQSNSYCDPNGAITADVTGGVLPYIFSWSNGENTNPITGLGEGLYTVTVTDQLGSTGTASAIITTPDPLILEIEDADETGSNANDGTAFVNVSAGAVPYTYVWSNGETTALIEDLAPGEYQVTVTDDGGCTAEATAIVNPFGCPELSLETSTVPSTCFESCDGFITIWEVINGAEPITYEWENGESTSTIDELCIGVYSVTVTDDNECVVLGTFEITQPAQLIANASSTNETLEGENNGTAWVVPSGDSVGPYMYLWSNGSTDSLIINLSPGTYTVTVTNEFECEALDTVTIEAGPCAILGGTVTDASCNGFCNGAIEVDPGFASYQWNNGSSSGDLNNLCAGDYTVIATTVDGCTITTTFHVSEPAPLEGTTGSTGVTIAGEDGTAWIIPAGGTPPYSYEWSNGSTDSLITNLEAGVYYVFLTDANSCLDTQVVFVDEFVCLQIRRDDVQDASCAGECDGHIFVLPLGGVGPFSYVWNTGDTTDFIIDLCAEFYGVTITDLGQGCEVFTDIEIEEPDSLFFTYELIHETDSTQASISITPGGGTPPYSNIWQGPNGFLSGNEDLVDIEPGQYTLSLFDNNNCRVVDSFEVLDLTVGVPMIPKGEVLIYPNPATSLIHIIANSNEPYSVELLSPLGATINTWQNAATIDVSGIAGGIYMVRFVNRDGYYVERILVQ